MHRIKRLAVCSLLAVLLVFTLSPALAQNATGSITGTVSDKTGGAVVGAEVVVVETQTNIRHQTKTNQSGAYTFSFLPIGTYEVTAQETGFKVAKQSNIRLSITDVARADLTMEIGEQTETVSVSASDVLLNTENAEVGTTVSQRLVSELPLNGRNFQQLLLLDGTAYSAQGNPMAQFRGSQTLADGGVVGVGGSRTSSTGFLIDGLNNRDIGYGSAILIPSIDALQEFKLQTKTYSAEYGGTSIQTQLHFKSGTNALHGTAYEFVRNNDFDAIGFNQTTVPRLNQNQFGYSLGGPVFIPKLYDGRNKTFFFANYEGLRVKQDTAPSFLIVPTAAQWSGTFSTPVIDPLTQLPFPGNQIPVDRISQFAKAYQPYAVQPNSTSASGNYYGSAPAPTTDNQQNYRIDQNIGPKNALFFRYSTSSVNATSGGINGTGLYAQTISQTQNHAYQISYTRIFTPNLVNQVTYGHVYAKFNTVAPTISETALSAFGIQGGFSPQPTPEIPNVIFSGSSGGLATFGTNANFPQVDVTDYWNGADFLTLNHGNHTITAGFSVLSWDHHYGKGANLGTWTFNGQYSENPFADFLLGNPSAISINVPSPLAPTAASVVFSYPQYTWSAYVQDQWKFSPRLTINAGLRYEFYLPAREAENRYDWFDFNTPGGALCTASQSAAEAVGQTGLLNYCGLTASPSPKLSFAPRIGIAYLPFKNSESTVIRAGYGLFYDVSDEGDTINASDNYPFLGQQSLNGTPITNVLSTTQEIPAITTLRPLQTSDLGFIFVATNKYQRPYSQNWTLTVENSPMKNTTIEVGFQGSTGTHYPTRYNLNQPFAYDPADPLPVSARRPYANFGEVYAQIYGLSSNYNAGVVKVRHDSRNLVVIAAYTFSKSFDVRSGSYGSSNNDVNGWAGPSDARNFRKDYGLSTFDIAHRAIFSVVNDIPVGRGQRYLSNVSRPVNALVGGWQWNGIITLQGGFPFSIGAADINGLVDSFGQRADQVGNPSPSGFNRSPAHWFNTAAFAQPAMGIFGDSNRNILRAPGVINFDLSVIKNFNITNRLVFQFRAESFNAFNHTNYYTPDNNIQDGSAFGVISAAAPARIIQLGGKLMF
jgi:hypothetical protein